MEGGVTINSSVRNSNQVVNATIISELGKLTVLRTCLRGWRGGGEETAYHPWGLATFPFKPGE